MNKFKPLAIALVIALCAPHALAVDEKKLEATQSLPKAAFDGQCMEKDALVYPISDPQYRYLEKDKPRMGNNDDRRSQHCGFMDSLMSEESLETSRQKIEKHDVSCIAKTCNKDCDRDCDNRFISELYESLLIKSVLESPALTSKILSIYQKIFDAFGKEEIKKTFDKWVLEDSKFPVNQKSRDWSLYNKSAALKNLVGVSHDPTSLLLSSDYLKELQYSLSPEFRSVRDYMFNNVLKKVRGYRTNSKGRKALEDNIGITSFDLNDLKLNPEYYQNKNWLHPGRSQCGTEPVQGMYQTEAIQKFVPLKCGVSGSTNFWIWTALFSGVDMSEEEVRLFIFSAFVVLGADGGHSLQEVLSSAAMSAVFMKYYEKYSDDQFLTKFIKRSNFANNLYEVTKNINPIGNRQFACIDVENIADHIYSRARYQGFDDNKNPNKSEIEHRKELEAFFLYENQRFNQPFADYATFLSELPDLNKARKSVGLKLKQYVLDYCINK